MKTDRKPLGKLIVGAVVVWVGALAMASAAHGSVLVSENFNGYGTGDIVTGSPSSNDGAGLSGGYSNSVSTPASQTSSIDGTVASGSLSYQGSSAAGNHLNITATSAGASLNYISLASTYSYANDPGQTVWVGFLIQYTSASVTRYAGVSLDDSAATNGIKADGEVEYGGIETGNSPIVYGVTLNNDDTANTTNSTPASGSGTSLNTNVHFLVASITFTSASQTAVSFWLDPDLGNSSPDTTQFTVPGTNVFAFNRIRIGAGGGNSTQSTNGQFNVDDITIGNSFSDLTSAIAPEPAPLGLLGMGLMAFAFRRPRRKLA